MSVLMIVGGFGLVVSIAGVAGWWWWNSQERGARTSSQASSPTATTTATTTPPVAPLPPGLVTRGDFTLGSPPGMEGDGNRFDDGANPSWRMQGPDDMAIDLPLKPTPGKGGIAVSCRVLIPTATTTDSQLGGVRIRFRLIDRHEGSGIADHVLEASDNWQTVGHTFEDTASGPYRLMIEAFGFTGPLYLDNVDARIEGSTAAGGVAGNVDSAPPAEAPVKSGLDEWVLEQRWFQRLAASMPAGVTLSIQETDGGFEGWTAFEIREHHSAESGFDPNVAPRVGLFEVASKRDGVGWYDPVNDEWQPIEDFIASRGL